MALRPVSPMTRILDFSCQTLVWTVGTVTAVVPVYLAADVMPKLSVRIEFTKLRDVALFQRDGNGDQDVISTLEMTYFWIWTLGVMAKKTDQNKFMNMEGMTAYALQRSDQYHLRISASAGLHNRTSGLSK